MKNKKDCFKIKITCDLCYCDFYSNDWRCHRCQACTNAVGSDYLYRPDCQIASERETKFIKSLPEINWHQIDLDKRMRRGNSKTLPNQKNKKRFKITSNL